MGFSVGFCPNLLANSQAALIPPVSSNPFLVSHISAISPLSAKIAAFHHMKKLKFLTTQTRASAEGIPSELVEDSKFVPLNADDPTYGPPALLLLGFEVEEAQKFGKEKFELKTFYLDDCSGSNLAMPQAAKLADTAIFKRNGWRILGEMINDSLWNAVTTKQPKLEEVKVAESLPRICFFSGLSGEEMMMFIDAFPESGLEPAIFAAMVPNSADKPVAELIDEIVGDHEMMTAQRQST
ncbi:hypothetical protein COLO4_36178 [Corchorus olitorius]|uniref:Uncharacterized protein n=1 Tax=Corchorus olitorius TaxID=93759 RepID=A0A1R3GAQ7_9ROSI|nr:hypothetical protein COLO4_36178 [Corchorus olitorius]